MAEDLKLYTLPDPEPQVTPEDVQTAVSSGIRNLNEPIQMQQNHMQSANYRVGTAGWKLDAEGNFEGNNGNFRGDITGATGTFSGTVTVGSLNVPDTTTANSMHVDTTGNTWWGANVATGHAGAPAKVLNTGAATFTNVAITGGSVTGTPISAIPNSTATDISLLSLTHNLVFSVTDADTIAWASGTITLSNGRTFSISAGNTGNMAALTYIYLDTAASTTVLQTTTTYSTAMGANKVLIGTAQNHAVTASFIPFQGGQPLVDGTQIGALSVLAANIADATITNAKIFDLAVSKLTAGTITSKSLNLAVADGSGDAEIRSGIATGDFDNAGNASGFIMGVDDSDADKVKFYFGNADANVSFNGTTFSITGNSNSKKNYPAAEAITAADAVAVGLYAADGGIAYDVYAEGSFAHTGGNKTISFTVANQSNRVLLAVIQGTGNATWQAVTTASGCTYNGVSMTGIADDSAISDSGNRTSIAAWLLHAPATGTNNLVFSSLGGTVLNPMSFNYCIYSIYNAAQTSTPHDFGLDATQRGNGGAGSNIAINSTATVDGCLTLIHGGDEAIFHDQGSGGDSGIMIPKGDYNLSTVVGNGGAAAATIVTIAPFTTPTAAIVRASAKAPNVTDYWATTSYKQKAFIGFANASISAGATGAVVIAGEAIGLSGLTLGTQYYLSDTYGAISTTVGTNTRKVAIATSSTTSLITNIW